MRTCGEIMTANPICCLSSDTVAHVAHLMNTEDIGSIPVVEAGNSRKLVGIVTDRDLALKVVSKNMDAQSTTVQQVMTHKPITCNPQDSLDSAMKKMSDHQIRRIPIVDKDNEILGIIAQADIATRVNEPQKTADVVEEVSKSEVQHKETTDVEN